MRNYGELSGLPAAKRLFAEILGCKPEECFIGGNASLMLMYGDFLRGEEGRSGLLRADFWYARAEEAGRESADGTAGLEQFRQAVRERRQAVRAELEK